MSYEKIRSKIMKTVAITTITGDNTTEVNYGNKLQAYALQEFLRLNGFEPETIHYKAKTPEYTSKLVQQRKISSTAQFVDDVLRIIKRTVYKKKISEKRENRLTKFREFQNKYIKFSKEMYTYDSDFSELGKQYDYYITGSDQVWNPYYEGYNPFYYLGYAPQGKRIAYAPSIAVNSIPKEIEAKYGEWIKGIDYLSIREEAGRALLNEKYGVNPNVVCDPVFLLDKEGWSKVSQKPSITGKFFVVYILGKKTVETKRIIKKLEKKYKIRAVDVYQRDSTEAYFPGPEEFVGLIENCEFILTDSFHGTAFSVIFQKPMVILERTCSSDEVKMNSRIDTLLSMIDAKNRDAKYIIDNPEELSNIYSGNNLLQKLIYDSKEYLLNALSDKTVE